MGTGIQESGMIARGFRTGVEFMLRTEDILAAIITSKSTKEAEIFKDYIEDQHGTILCDVTIPVDKIAEFSMEMDARQIPYIIIDQNKGTTVSGSKNFRLEGGKLIESESKEPKYVSVMYKGPIYLYEPNGQIKIDDNGNRVAQPGSSMDAKTIHNVAAKLNSDYLARLEIESKEKAHELSTLEANRNFAGQETIKINVASLTEAQLIQSRMDEQRIDNHILKTSDNRYEVEVNALDAVRVNPHDMSDLERVLVDCEIGMNLTDVKEYVSAKEKYATEVADLVNDIRNGNLNNHKVILSLDEGLSEKDSVKQVRHIEIYGTQAIVGKKEYNLTNKEDFSKFETAVQKFDNAAVIDYDTYLKTETNKFDFTRLKEVYVKDQETFAKFESIKDTAFHMTRELEDNPKTRDLARDLGELVDDPKHRGNQMMEFRIAESSVVIAETMQTASNGMIDASELNEVMKQKENDFIVSAPSPYQPTPIYVSQTYSKMTYGDLLIKEQIQAEKALAQDINSYGYEVHDDMQAAIDEQVEEHDRVTEMEMDYYDEHPELLPLPEDMDYDGPEIDMFEGREDMPEFNGQERDDSFEQELW